MSTRLGRLRDALLLAVGSNALAAAALLAVARAKAGNTLAGYAGFSPSAQTASLVASAVVAGVCLGLYALLPPPGGPSAASRLTRGRDAA
jgi:hypothetical protein